MKPRIPVRIAARVVARSWGTTVAKLQERRKYRQYSVPRHVAYWIAVRHGGDTYSNVADFFGRHHASAMDGVASIERRMAADPELAARANDAAVAAAVIARRGVDLVPVGRVQPTPVAAAFHFVRPDLVLDRYSIRVI